MTESPESSVNARTIRDAIAETLERESVAALITVIKSPNLNAGAKLFVADSGETFGDLGQTHLNHAVTAAVPQFFRGRAEVQVYSSRDIAPLEDELPETQLLFERIEAEPQLVIAGAGHVGAALARLGALVRYRVTLIDDRAEFVSRDAFAAPTEQDIELVTAADWAAAIRAAVGAGRGVSVAIVTRGHKQDEECLRAVLASNPDYIGMIGSKRRTNIVLDKLREEDFAEAQLRKVRAPIGLDIRAVSPEEVALAILAEIVAERRGGKGGSLSSWRRS